jgi:hypothetical protein
MRDRAAKRGQARTEEDPEDLAGRATCVGILQVLRDSAQVIREFAQEVGLTPSARARIVVTGEGQPAGLAGRGGRLGWQGAGAGW